MTLKTGSAFKDLFWPLLACQLPAALLESMVSLVDIQDQQPTAPVIALFLGLSPFVFIALFFSSGATLLLLSNWRAGRKESLKQIGRRLGGKARPLSLAAVLIGTLLSICVMEPFLVPVGIVFWTLYLFVPFFIVSDAPAPLMAYFNRSTRLARAFFLKTVAVVILLFLITLATYVVDSLLKGWSLALFGEAAVGIGFLLLTKFLFACLVEAGTNLGVASYFLSLKEGGSNEIALEQA